MGAPEGQFDRSWSGRRCAERLFRRAWRRDFAQWICQYRWLYLCLERGFDSAAAEQLEHQRSEWDALDARYGHVGNKVCAGAAGKILKSMGCAKFEIFLKSKLKANGIKDNPQKQTPFLPGFMRYDIIGGHGNDSPISIICTGSR